MTTLTMTSPSTQTAPLITRVSEFISTENALLDDRKFEEWMELFTEDGYYWAPVAQDQEDPYNHVSLFYDTVPTMRTRIRRLRSPKIFMQTPHSRTLHMTSNVQICETSGTSISARCNFIMFEYRPSRPQNIWGGRYDYEIKADGESFQIAKKKALLVNSDDEFPSLAIWF